MSGNGRWPSRMSRSGREAILDVREWSGCLPGCPGAFRRPHGYPRVVERPSQMSGSGCESLLDVWQWSGGPPRCPGVVGRPCQM